MSEAAKILKACRSVLLVDWPLADVPETLAWAGFTVYVKGGPGANDFSVHELRDGAVLARRTGHRPVQVDLVYVHRPLDELPPLLATAKEMGAYALWYQSGLTSDGSKAGSGCWLPARESERVRGLVEDAGLRYVDDRYIVDCVRELTPE